MKTHTVRKYRHVVSIINKTYEIDANIITIIKIQIVVPSNPYIDTLAM